MPEAPVLPAMQRDIAHMQPSVEGLIQSLFQARLKELKDTAAASSGMLTPRSPHSPAAAPATTVRGTVLRRISGHSAAADAPPPAAPAARPRASLSRHSDMSAVLARQTTREAELQGRVHKSTSAGTLAGPDS